jgi:hypothetical protein
MGIRFTSQLNQKCKNCAVNCLVFVNIEYHMMFQSQSQIQSYSDRNDGMQAMRMPFSSCANFAIVTSASCFQLAETFENARRNPMKTL